MRVHRTTTRTALLAAAALSLVLAACGGAEEEAEAPAPAPAATEEAAEEPEEAAEEPREPVFLSFATGGTGGAYYPYGGALANLLEQNLDWVTTTVEATGASVENLRLLDSGDAEVVHVQADAIFRAYNGTGPFEEDGPIAVRTLISKYPNIMQLLTTDSSIATYEDLAGKRVSVGAAGSGVELTLGGLMVVLGDDYSIFGQTLNLSYNDQTSAFRDDQIDVGNYQGALGLAAATDLASTNPVTAVSFTEEQIAAIMAELPYHKPGIIPAGTYNGIDEDVLTPALWNFVAVSADMDRELAYLITKLAYENQDALIAGHPQGANTTLDNVLNAVVPFHPGAIDYFLEVGLEIPDELYPEEWTE